DIPTTSTIMYGHIETYEDVVIHLDILRNIQKETGKFTEFVPLSFIHEEAPMFNLNLVKGIKKTNGVEVLKMHAISRIFFNHHIKNIQVSWVKEGPRMSQILLGAGVNDMGGCLINESISTAAGSQYGQFMRPREMRQIISDVGKTPAQRSSTYRIIKNYETIDEINSESSLDNADSSIFGSYRELISLNKFRFKKNGQSDAKG
ncbi:MAG: 7,8-didemethyl-8-hydroxy-5-deazariboflavin synthase subunit CofH, partial [Thermoproteota archaeon]|nr:7,8-didemethyl-8-hydroxy-5-deazariboflavin synthase subunit CofH [Thermoproteota archaeon]